MDLHVHGHVCALQSPFGKSLLPDLRATDHYCGCISNDENASRA